MLEQFDAYIFSQEESNWWLVPGCGLVRLLLHPKGGAKTIWLEETGGELFVVREKWGRHQ